MITHTNDSQVKTRQNKTKSKLQIKKNAKNYNFEILQETLHATLDAVWRNNKVIITPCPLGSFSDIFYVYLSRWPYLVCILVVRFELSVFILPFLGFSFHSNVMQCIEYYAQTCLILGFFHT